MPIYQMSTLIAAQCYDAKYHVLVSAMLGCIKRIIELGKDGYVKLTQLYDHLWQRYTFVGLLQLQQSLLQSYPSLAYERQFEPSILHVNACVYVSPESYRMVGYINCKHHTFIYKKIIHSVTERSIIYFNCLYTQFLEFLSIKSQY